MKRALICAVLLLALGATARAADFSPAGGLTTTPALIIPVAPSTRSFLRLINVGVAGSASIWCSWSLTKTLAPNMPGSYELPPAGAVVDQFISPGYVPTEAIWCVSASGTEPLTAVAKQ